MNLGIVGSRSFQDAPLMKKWILKFLATNKDLTIVSGGANGADQIAKSIAHDMKLKYREFKPDWSIGKSAGPIRNKQIIDSSDTILAFWDCASRGTKNTIDQAISNKIPIIIIPF